MAMIIDTVVVNGQLTGVHRWKTSTSAQLLGVLALFWATGVGVRMAMWPVDASKVALYIAMATRSDLLASHPPLDPLPLKSRTWPLSNKLDQPTQLQLGV